MEFCGRNFIISGKTQSEGNWVLEDICGIRTENESGRTQAMQISAIKKAKIMYDIKIGTPGYAYHYLQPLSVVTVTATIQVHGGSYLMISVMRHCQLPR